MLSLETLISDSYNRKARLQPALLTLLPILVAAVLLIPEIQLSWTPVIGLAIYCGGAMWLAHFARDRGKALESTLFRAWGGMPSVAMLRHRDSRIEKRTKERYRAFLKRRIPNLELASKEEEECAPSRADGGYESATSWLLTQTRDRKRFHLVFEENINYGFRRNLWALKPLAMIMDILLVILMLAMTMMPWSGDMFVSMKATDKSLWIAMLVTFVHAGVFMVIIRAEWVLLPAEAYAKQLLSACDILESQAGR